MLVHLQYKEITFLQFYHPLSPLYWESSTSPSELYSKTKTNVIIVISRPNAPVGISESLSETTFYSSRQKEEFELSGMASEVTIQP